MMTLHEYLKSNAIRQMDFAPRIGVTQGTVSRFCTGRAVPDIVMAAKIQKETGGAVPMDVWAPEEYRLGAQAPQKGVV